MSFFLVLCSRLRIFIVQYRPGYLAFEFILYFFLMTLLITLVMQWAATSQVQLQAALYAAHDVLVRDVLQAPADLTLWYSCSTNNYCWHAQGVDVGWYVIEGALMRLEGAYNRVTHEWIARQRSLMAQGVTTLELNEVKGAARALECVLQGRVGKHSERIARTVYVRNGVGV
jgi:hypothetical protein